MSAINRDPIRIMSLNRDLFAKTLNLTPKQVKLRALNHDCMSFD